MSWSIFDSARSITTTIAAEMAEAVSGGPHYRILFMLGALLFAVTFVSNMVGEVVITGSNASWRANDERPHAGAIPARTTQSRHFRAEKFDFWSFFFTGLTGLATLFILGILAVILLNIVINGWRGLVAGISSRPFRKRISSTSNTTGVLPMIVGTTIRVILMTIFVIPVGVITAIYLTEYAPNTSLVTRIIRAAVNNLAGVPSIVFGLFGLGFFINFIGKNMDALLHNPSAVWGQPALIWASLTLAVMTLPVVIVATEESLKAIPPGLREASLALGATKLETIFKIVLPQALPGIMTGGILAVSRAAGEVAPILFTGAAYYMASTAARI